MEECSLVGVGHEQKDVPEIEMKSLQSKVRELERILGKKTLENEILKERIRIDYFKKLISRTPLLEVENFL
jgi:transposase